LSTQRYVSHGNIALVYNGLGKRDKTLARLQRGFEQRDPKMVFLKVEPKWNNLRDDRVFKIYCGASGSKENHCEWPREAEIPKPPASR
jgi:hypothetical protein